MENEIFENYIKNEFENEFLDFKIKPYDWKSKESKEDFLRDVLSLANSITNNDRYIILGAKVKPNGERILKGIDTKELKDSSDYQQIVTEHIEPEISIEVKIVNIDNLDYGIIRIFNCNDRPYVIKKKYENLEQGFIETRRGSRNTNISRYFLDEMYSLKNPKLRSEFAIYGLDEGYIVDEIRLKKYDFLPDMSKEKENLVELLKSINDIIIDDINNNIEINAKKPFGLSALSDFYSKNSKKEIDKSIVCKIDGFAKAVGIKLNDSFYDIGNLSERFAGLSSGNMGSIRPKFITNGSPLSEKKYNLILQLNSRLEWVISWSKFIDSIEDFGYIELAIKEIGNTPDEEVEVNLELPKNSYIDYEKFPTADSSIVNEINSKYSECMFKVFYNSEISDFRKMPLSSSNHMYFPNINPLHSNSIEIITGLFDYIDYDVSFNNEKTILNFTIKSIKENEVMAFPGKIIVRGDVDEIKYSIISKKSKEKINGMLHVIN